jgi:hypothetical protein
MHGAAATRVPERFGGQRLPTVEAIDLRRERPPPGHFISPPLAAAVKTALERREQALLFLNRRGYAPLTLCRACVWERIAKLGALPSDVTPLRYGTPLQAWPLTSATASRPSQL